MPPKKPQPKTNKKFPKKNPAGKHAKSDVKEKRLFRSLCAQIDGGHFRNALKTCDAILRVYPKDLDALQTKLFLLLQTEQYESALTLVSSPDVSSAKDLEKAYALYGLRREDDAMGEVSRIKTNTPGASIPRGVLLLEAQLSYRQRDYQAAFDKYSHLLDTCPANSEEHVDLSTNLDACQAHLDFLANGYLHALDEVPASAVNDLEEAPPPNPPPPNSIAASARFPVALIAQNEAPVKKRARSSRVPEGVKPGVTSPPDPERWIKKSERSNYGQAHGRRKRQGGGATQGISADAASQGGKSGKNKKK